MYVKIVHCAVAKEPEYTDYYWKCSPRGHKTKNTVPGRLHKVNPNPELKPSSRPEQLPANIARTRFILF